MESHIQSISSSSTNIRQDVFPIGQWTITTRKGIIMQSKCTCDRDKDTNKSESDKMGYNHELCNICKYYSFLPQLHNMPDMLFGESLLRLEHYTGVGIEFTALAALKHVEETKDPLQVAVAGGWQSARADFPFAKSVLKPFDWTFTTNYQGTLLSKAIKRNKTYSPATKTTESLCIDDKSPNTDLQARGKEPDDSATSTPAEEDLKVGKHCLTVEATDERIDINKLKVREDILFYDDVTLYEDELADHGTAQYSIKVRVMPKSLYILARYYLRVDGVLARINDTRIYHELNKKYLLREYTNREAKLDSLNLPVCTLVNPNELMNHLPLIQSRYEKLLLPQLR